MMWKVTDCERYLTFFVLICIDFVKSDNDFDLCGRDQKKSEHITRNSSWKGWRQRGGKLKGECLVGII